MSDWRILTLTWVAVEVIYGVLAIVASVRLRGRQKKLNQVVLVAMAVLVGAKSVIRRVLGGQAYMLAVLLVGVASGGSALLVAGMLMSRKPDDENEVAGADKGDGGIQLLKLS